MKGWLLTEEFRLDEALPLLQRATKTNPNDASSHRFLGNLYDRRADPTSALSHFSAGGRARPDGFHLARVPLQELIDLGEFGRSARQPARGRGARPEQHVGPTGHLWIARAQGKTA